jgi:hypothetical protein
MVLTLGNCPSYNERSRRLEADDTLMALTTLVNLALTLRKYIITQAPTDSG